MFNSFHYEKAVVCEYSIFTLHKKELIPWWRSFEGTIKTRIFFVFYNRILGSINFWITTLTWFKDTLNVCHRFLISCEEDSIILSPRLLQHCILKPNKLKHGKPKLYQNLYWLFDISQIISFSYILPNIANYHPINSMPMSFNIFVLQKTQRQAVLLQCYHWTYFPWHCFPYWKVWNPMF